MYTSIRSLPPGGRLAALLLCAGLSLEARPASLTMVVSDRSGQPVPEVVVYAVAAEKSTTQPVPRTPTTPVVMDQRFEQFRPHVLIAQTGSAISFPNADTVAHHVYSFSEPKQFELPLYQGTAHPPVTFDRPGVIDIGCNIHDHMEAHIVIVDTPFFAATGIDGRAVITDVPSGDYTVKIYSPRLRVTDHPVPQAIAVSGDSDAIVQIRLEGRLRPPHVSENESLNWSRY